jgi:hypothetical protein
MPPNEIHPPAGCCRRHFVRLLLYYLTCAPRHPNSRS